MGRKPTHDPENVYSIYYGSGQQSATKTGAILGIPAWKVYDYRRRYGFDERYAKEIASLTGPAIEQARATVALGLGVAASYLMRVVEDHSEDTRNRVMAASKLMDKFPADSINAALGGGVTLTLIDARKIVEERKKGELEGGREVDTQRLKRLAGLGMNENIRMVDESRTRKG